MIRLLVGYSTKQIADEFFKKSKSPITCVQGHLKEIYKNYEYFLENADSESKRSHLIILFYRNAPALVAKLAIELGSPIPSRHRPNQFGTLPDEHKFELHRVALVQSNDTNNSKCLRYIDHSLFVNKSL